MDDNELITAVRDRFDPVRMRTRTETVLARGRSLRRRRRAGVAGGVLAIALGAGLAVPALTAASPEHVTLAAWTVDQRPDDSIAVSIRELRDLPALQRVLKADGVLVTITQTKTFPEGQPKACPVREWSAFSGVRFEGTGRYFFVLHPAKFLPGTVLKITVIPGIRQPAGAPRAIPLVPSGAGARRGSPRFQPAPAGIGYAYPGATPSVMFTPVRDVPSCLS
jgi:hypothetical protein